MKAARKWKAIGIVAIGAVVAGRVLIDLGYPAVGWGVTLVSGVVVGLMAGLQAIELREEERARPRHVTIKVPMGGQVLGIRTWLPADVDFQKWIQCHSCGAGVLSTAQDPAACALCGSPNVTVGDYTEASGEAGGGL